MATSHMADQIGRVLGGRYRLAAAVGTGASAHVYSAEDIRLRRRVAVKILHPALAEDEAFLRRFRAEAQAVAALRHPNIMSVHDWGEDDDGPYLVLELLGGGSLRDLLDAGQRLSPSQAVVVGLEAARALDYAHRRGLVHRDIKPANLLFDDEGRLCIADFGLARALAEAAWTEPAGAVLGTARYASPEQARGGSVDGASDVYSLATVLVEAVTGQAPFAADTTIATLMARVDRPLEAPDSLGPLAPVLEAAGTVDPSQRLDAAALVRRLEAVAADLPSPEPLPIAVGTAAASPPALDDLTEMPVSRPGVFDVEAEADDQFPPVPAPRRRRWPLVALLTVLALLAAGGAGYAVVQARVPSHQVPSLLFKTVEEAGVEVAEEGFVVEVVRRQYDEQVDKDRIIEQDPPSTKSLKEGRTVAVVVSDGPAPRLVPSLAGMTQADAEKVLTEQRFTPVVKLEYSDTVEKGIVVTWTPRDGPQPRGAEVVVTVSDGRKPVKIPSLLDKAFDEARKILEGLGLVARPEEAFSDDIVKGKVISTRPPGGEEVANGSEVVVRVSKGPDEVAVPNVVGQEFAAAKQILQSAGLQVDGPFGPPSKTRVFASDPPPGTKVKRGTTVDLFVR